MRLNRAKFIRKYLRFFRVVFNLIPKYNVILDGNFIFAAIKFHVDIQERLTKLLQGEEIRLFILKSSLQELERQKSKAAASLAFAKSFCEVLNDDDSIGDTVEEKVCHFISSTREEAKKSSRARQYMIATQDKDLRQSLGRIPGVPLIYLNKVIMVLEPPSDSSVKYNKKHEILKSSLQESEEEIVSNLKARGIGAAIEVAGEVSGSTGYNKDKSLHERKKRKAVESNPLSCRKTDPNSSKFKKARKDKLKRRRGCLK